MWSSWIPPPNFALVLKYGFVYSSVNKWFPFFNLVSVNTKTYFIRQKSKKHIKTRISEICRVSPAYAWLDIYYALSATKSIQEASTNWHQRQLEIYGIADMYVCNNIPLKLYPWEFFYLVQNISLSILDELNSKWPLFLKKMFQKWI